MHSRRFSKAIAAAILAVSVLATGSTAPAGAATDKALSHQAKRLDTGASHPSHQAKRLDTGASHQAKRLDTGWG